MASAGGAVLISLVLSHTRLSNRVVADSCTFGALCFLCAMLSLRTTRGRPHRRRPDDSHDFSNKRDGVRVAPCAVHNAAPFPAAIGARQRARRDDLDSTVAGIRKAVDSLGNYSFSALSLGAGSSDVDLSLLTGG